MKELSPDHEERIEDFLRRHGGAGQRASRDDEQPGGAGGWSEVYAADGYTLRCDWSQIGSRKEMCYTEVA